MERTIKLDNAYSLFEKNINLVYLALKQFHSSDQDLFQAGCIGLYHACLKYDYRKGFQLSTIAMPYIIGEIKKEIRNDKIRLPKRIYPIISYMKNNEKYTLEEIVNKFNVKPDIVLDAIYYKSFVVFDESIYLSCDSSLKVYLDDLDDVEKRVILLYYKRRLYIYDIAKILNLSVHQVSRIIKKSLQKIKGSIK